MGQIQIILVEGPEVSRPDRRLIRQSPVGLVGVVFHRLKSKLLGSGSARDFRPRAAKDGVIFRCLANLRNDRRIFGKRSSIIHGFDPLFRTLQSIEILVVLFGDGFEGFFGLQMELFLHARGGLPFKRFVQNFTPKRLILLKLVGRHEQVCPRRVKTARRVIGG